MKHLKILLIALLAAGNLPAQVVRLDFPHFAGKEYIYILHKGEIADTIQKGSLDKKGQTILSVPKSRSGYKGVASFRLLEGGGMNILLNNEKAFLIRCTETHPDDGNISYIGSKENNYLNQSYQKQEKLLRKSGAAQIVLQTYTPTDSLHIAFKREANRLATEYADCQAQEAKSPLLAARLRKLHNFIRGFGSRLNQTEEERRQDLLDFFSKQADIDLLYSSGDLWNDTFSQWMELQMERKNDTLLASDSRELLARIHSPEIRKVVMNKLVLLYAKYGKDSLLSSLGISQLDAGNIAPELVTENAKYTPANSLIIFYETGCGKCENELTKIAGYYAKIKEKGYDVISIAADRNKAEYEQNVVRFPWKEKICDFNGFDGINFKNYQVVGTPTIFVVNKDGKIIGRYAQLSETNIIN